MTGIKKPLKHLIYLAIAMMLQFAVMETTRSSYHFFLNLIFSALPLGYLTFVYVSYIFGNILYCSLYCASIYIYYIIYLTIRQPSGVVGYKQIQSTKHSQVVSVIDNKGKLSNCFSIMHGDINENNNGSNNEQINPIIIFIDYFKD